MRLEIVANVELLISAGVIVASHLLDDSDELTAADGLVLIEEEMRFVGSRSATHDSVERFSFTTSSAALMPLSCIVGYVDIQRVDELVSGLEKKEFL